MTIDELQAADAILIDIAETLAMAIQSQDDNCPPDDDTSEDWDDLWYDHRRKLDAGFREVCKQRLALVKAFTEHAMGGGQSEVDYQEGNRQ